MKINLRKIITVLVFTLAFGAAYSAFGQGPNVGGYQKVSVDARDVVIAADFAVKAKGKELNQTLRVEKIKKAETQVVQGKNYRMCLDVYAPPAKEGEDGVQVTVEVVVWRNFDGTYKLTKWEDQDCGDDQ
ncbi:MAG: hypothetical protein JSS81_01305 [Acidobacteria bacterium]|nr:hypothetical protein [Acidobacteriota bacterium]